MNSSKKKNKKISVLNGDFSITTKADEYYISRTYMFKSKDGDLFIPDLLRNMDTVEFLGIVEQVHNPDFNYGEYAIISSRVVL